MFGLFFFILFTPGVSEFICTSSDLDMSYTFCGNPAHGLSLYMQTCDSLGVFAFWSSGLEKIQVFYWKERSDIHFLKIVFKVWYDGARSLLWKELLCSGADDKYSVCGTLKGETLVSAFDIKGSRINFPKGNYSIIVQGFSDDSENNMLICLNFTMIVKQDAY
ncbi:LY96 protein, partial [Buphagus erythrorhynchus]|nr:LY96 protein [Buphagus erythrorhynchus]